jgi:exodeoxyribonuclease VII large subunit
VQDVVLSPSEFVALFNQTLEFAYPSVVIEGELMNFRVSKNRWVYFDLQDDESSIKFFGTVYNLPGPLEDGLKIQVLGAPRLHPRFGFSVNVSSIAPVGQGSIKKAADLLMAKLEAEGLFDPARKRALPAIPKTIGLITAAKSAAYTDFVKILDERWGGLEIQLADVYVQGAQAPLQIVKAIDYFNELSALVDVLVITRGGGSADDLAAFNDERVVRAVAASRIPTLVAVGHEIDVSLAELAADQRASTPSNAAQIVTPNRQQLLDTLKLASQSLSEEVERHFQTTKQENQQSREYLTSQVNLLLSNYQNQLVSIRKLILVFNPQAALKRGYAIIKKGTTHITSRKQLRSGDKIQLQLVDGAINATAGEPI